MLPVLTGPDYLTRLPRAEGHDRLEQLSQNSALG